MKVKDIMTRNVEVVKGYATIREAAKKMKDLDVGSLPVVDEQKQVVGIITDRDIVIRGIADGRNADDTQVQQVMTSGFVFGLEDMEIKEAANLMGEKQIRRLPVVDHENHLIGIISLGDLSVDSGNEKMAGQTLEDISKPSKPDR